MSSSAILIRPHSCPHFPPCTTWMHSVVLIIPLPTPAAPSLGMSISEPHLSSWKELAENQTHTCLLMFSDRVHSYCLILLTEQRVPSLLL